MGQERNDRETLHELARQTRAWIEWMADSGLEQLAVQSPPSVASASDVTETGIQPDQGAPSRQPPPSEVQRQPAFQPPGLAATSESASPPTSSQQSEPPLSPSERRVRLQVLADEVSRCVACKLHESRHKTVFSRGSPDAALVFVGEGPGQHEDEQGQPFVGAAGQLLDKMVGAMGFARDGVYICNVVKCRPPDNRKPTPEEIEACGTYLRQQLEIIQPKVVVALGATGVQGLLGKSGGITRMRGQWKLYRGRVPLMPTFHPAYLLRSPEKKRDVWNDLQEVMTRLGKPSDTPEG